MLLALVVLVIPACGHTKAKLQQADAEFADRVGRDKREDIVAIMGLPAKKEIVGEVEVWVYQSNQVGKTRGVPFTMGGGNSYVQADELVLTFGRDGFLKTYRANVNKVK